MNDLRQQQMVAATSSSGSGSAPGAERATATTTTASSNSNSNSSSSSSSSSSSTTRAAAAESSTAAKAASISGLSCSTGTVTLTGSGAGASNNSEEEQRVSSTSSPAQREQPLNADHHGDDIEQEDQDQGAEQRRQQHHHQPGHITSTTASPPPPPQQPQQQQPSTQAQALQEPPHPQDAPGSTTEAPASAPASAAAAAAAEAEASSTGGGEGAEGAMAATAIDVKGEERDGHKIILKLSKHAASAAASASASASSASSASGPNSNANESQAGGDERRVEPLRIQLTSSEGAVAKPQDASDADASSCSSSCAEDEVASSLVQHQHPRSTPHIVPKLTIRAANEERVGSVVPKLTIKLPENPAGGGSSSSCSSGPGASSTSATLPAKNDAHLSSLSPASASSSSASSSSSSSSSSSLAEVQTVPKLMIKTTVDGSSCVTSNSSSSSINSAEHEHPHQQIPKLTIKTGGSISSSISSGSGSGSGGGSEHMHTLIMKHDLSNAQSIPKLTIKTKAVSVDVSEQSEKQPLPKLTIKNLCSPNRMVRAVLEEKLPATASKLAHAHAHGHAPGIGRAAAAGTAMTNGAESNSSSQEFCGFSDPDADEGRRNSDDMDIDESLSKEHDPQMFHNLPPSNGIAGKPNPGQLPPAPHNVVDMVDLTSSPSPGSSPAHVPANNFAGRLEGGVASAGSSNSSAAAAAAAAAATNILLSQLTAPAKSFTTASPKSNSSRYPQLTERLLANGVPLPVPVTVPVTLPVPVPVAALGAGNGEALPVGSQESEQPGAPLGGPAIIESIEILDTPEGSPRPDYLQEGQHVGGQVLNNHRHHQALHKAEAELQEMDNNNENHLKRTSSAGNESPDSGVSAPPCFRASFGLPNRLLAPQITPNKQRRLDNDENNQQTQNCHEPVKKCNASPGEAVLQAAPLSHRSRKQKHERILNTELEDALFPAAQQQQQQPEQNGTVGSAFPELNATEGGKVQDPLEQATSLQLPPTPVPPASTGKRRGRPKRIQTPIAAADPALALASPATTSRRVQLLRKRLAIDMVSQEQLTDAGTPGAGPNETNPLAEDEAAGALETPTRRDRQLRATRRTTTPSQSQQQPPPPTPKTRKRQSKANAQLPPPPPPPTLSQFGAASGSEAESNNNNNNNNSSSSNNMAFALAAQIDLTMCSSSSSTSSGAPGTQAGVGGSGSSSMLPPTTILSSSDPLPDVIFQPNDFSSIMATQQLRSPRPASISGGSQVDSHDEDTYNSVLDHSGDESASAVPVLTATPTPTRGRGRGRGSRGGRGSASANRASGGGGTGGSGTSTNSQPRAPRMSRGASAVAKAIAMSRPRCVGGLKHTPDPQRLKGLFSPSPQVFEEDTRMSADLSNSSQSMASLMEPPLTPQKQPDFLNNEESQSSMVSNMSQMDSNQSQPMDPILGSSQKRPKKKKMEICVAEDTDYSACSIAEYDWPPPKGCCPSKNRDTFMIQEQVALYLGITSFKRKYPDLPRRPVDMEERNWLQEKGLVSEKMCDLGITAVWASDILDIMYADFYDKYEEYKEYIRQKHLREIEAKQKALGLTVGATRGLQARDRAMLSASKWNVYFNKTRKEERQVCLDLQTFTMNQPQESAAPASTLLQRPMANVVRAAAEAENIPAPPCLLQPRDYSEAFRNSDYAYPLTVVPDQFSFSYRQYDPAELRAFPLDTALAKPPTEQELQLQAQLRQRISSEADRQRSVEEAPVSTCEASKEAAAAAAEATAEPSTSKTVTVTTSAAIPVRRSRRALRQHPDKARTASNCSTSSAEFVSSGSSNNSSSSDTDSGDESDSSASSSSNASNSAASSSSASSDDEAENDNGNESARAIRLFNCGVCLRTQNRNARNMPEAFIRCYTCRRRVHPSCIEMPPRMVGRARSYNWQCADCKCCIKCRGPQTARKMLYCEQCDRGYHIYCLGVRTVPEGKWWCERAREAASLIRVACVSGRWSCERCSVCLRCGATRPEGLPHLAALASAGLSPSGERAKGSAGRVKRAQWLNEYRTDHVSKLREHAAMFCEPCSRLKPPSPQTVAASQECLSRDSSPSPAAASSASSSSSTSNPVAAPSPSPSSNGGQVPSPDEALSPKMASTASASMEAMSPSASPQAPMSPAVASISRRQQGTPVNITTMQCSSSLGRNGNGNGNGNGGAEDSAPTATATITATATATATTAAAASTAVAGGSPAPGGAGIGIAPPPVVA
ncbi:hypothetical protein KR018_003670 [Drosophila ironensis]|nr:hypothetical protein KR018_003670 [Drosophila ironensis]